MNKRVPKVACCHMRQRIAKPVECVCHRSILQWEREPTISTWSLERDAVSHKERRQTHSKWKPMQSLTGSLARKWTQVLYSSTTLPTIAVGPQPIVRVVSNSMLTKLGTTTNGSTIWNKGVIHRTGSLPTVCISWTRSSVACFARLHSTGDRCHCPMYPPVYHTTLFPI